MELYLFPTHVLVPIEGLDIKSVHLTAHQFVVSAASTTPTVQCPTCRTASQRVHSRYTRSIADVPYANRRLTIHLLVRRFFCPVAHCERKTFAEHFGPMRAAYARRTTRLTTALQALAFGAGGQGGARLAHQLAIPISPRTLLRLIHAQPTLPVPEPRVIGLDDWAWKKGRNYGTISVDLEQR